MAKAKTKHYIKIEISVPITKKAFLKQQTSDFEKDHISKVSMVRNKILTAGKIDTLVKTGVLEKIKYKGKIYFSKQDIEDIIKNQKINLKLFS